MKLCWFRNIEQDFPLWDTSVHKISRDKYLTSLNKECQRYEKGHSFAVNLINFIIITLIYYITKQRVCETISIIKMLTISKNLVWPRDRESFKGGKFNTLSLVDCYVQICNGTAVVHGSLLNCSDVCDGINCCKSVIITT
jgi:hypothetical protein